MRVCPRLTVPLGAAVLLCGATADALINPHFTPVHLVKQAGLILVVELKPGATKDQYVGTVREAVKGKTPPQTFRLDLASALNPENAEAFRELARDGRPALLFAGDFGDVDAKDARSEAPAALLSIAGQWAELDGGPHGAWALRRFEAKWQGVWAGGTDMLRRAADYILQDDDPDVPVIDGAAWGTQRQIAMLEGRIRAVRPIDLSGTGRPAVFVARDQGDRLLVCDPQTRAFTDVTAARRLQARSQAFAWGDFDGNGRVDLMSFDGTALSLHAQGDDGTFRARPVELAGALDHGCVGLAPVDAETKATAGLLISTNSWPILVVFDATGKASCSTLAAPGLERQKLGRSGLCLVADFDGDATADVLQPLAEGSLLYRGVGAGQFRAGAACAVKLGGGETAATLGDFDADGLLDVLGVGADGIRLWQNDGGGKFTEALGLSGEIAYIGKPGGVDCTVGDINNDGRQDALIAYGSLAPQLFFNRGYRSFGHAHTLDLAERQLLAAAEQGQQSATLGDFDGDAAQDMVLALRSGAVWVFFRDNEDREARSVTVTLPAGGPRPGPVTVTGWLGKRCLGAWNVLPGTRPAFFGRREAGPVTLKWRLPGGPAREREVVVESGTVRVDVN